MKVTASTPPVAGPVSPPAGAPVNHGPAPLGHQNDQS
jgi:hypothetical protein